MFVCPLADEMSGNIWLIPSQKSVKIDHPIRSGSSPNIEDDISLCNRAIGQIIGFGIQFVFIHESQIFSFYDNRNLWTIKSFVIRSE